MTADEQYLPAEELQELVAISDFSGFQPVSTDSYSDTEIYKTIKARGGMKPLLFCALQTAVMGSGNKVFGEFELNGETIDVRAVYKEFGVRDDLSLQSKLEPGELTPRRLQRFFRVQIKDYLEQNPEVYPELWTKYSTVDPQFRTVTFPGGEALVETREEGLYLLETYRKLDQLLETTLSERVKQVLLARKVLDAKDIV